MKTITTPTQWKTLELQLPELPEVANPFDPEQITVNLHIKTPSGKSLIVPAFWYQEYSRALEDGAEKLTIKGTANWRIRFTPTEAGQHQLELNVVINGESIYPTVQQTISVGENTPKDQHGWVELADNRYFQTSDGLPLRLIGENVCWDIGRGTFDFDDWFQQMAKSGQNFARLWFSPWSIGIEHGPGTLTNYSMEDAWQLDHIFSLAHKHHIYLMISFDHHGMYQTNENTWGGTNAFWNTHNPYSAQLGGPCEIPNDFFAMPEAREIYKKRLRYLVARYGYSPYLQCWQFFNEIDNVFPRENLDEPVVYDWHDEMGQWLKENDPYKHLVSSSLTGGSDRPELWKLPTMDFSVYHSYNDPAPARTIAQIAHSFVDRYKKPVFIGEFGTSAWGLNMEKDPFLRGFRQGLWGGVMGGSVGSSMSWWWETIHSENLYSIYHSMHKILKHAGWESGKWEPIEFPQTKTPIELEHPKSDSKSFTADLALNSFRQIHLLNKAAITTPLSAIRSSEFLQNHLKNISDPGIEPTLIRAYFSNSAKLILKVNAVSGNGTLNVSIDGQNVFTKEFKDEDQLAKVNDEINETLSIPIPDGLHTLELSNTSGHWIYLDGIKLENVYPSNYTEGWDFTVDVLGLKGKERAIVYLITPETVFPANALDANPPMLTGYTLSLPNWPVGSYTVQWFLPKTGDLLATEKWLNTGENTLEAPRFNEDLVAVIQLNR